MPMKVSKFYSMVQDDYGQEIADKWKAKIAPDREELTFTEAMNTLDAVFLGDNKPCYPQLGRTDSKSYGGRLEFKV